MMKKRYIRNGVILVLISIAVICVIYTFSRNKEKLMADALPEDIISRTDRIEFYTVENNLSPKKTMVNDKNEVHDFYEWIGSLEYKRIDKSKQGLEPGTEYTIRAYDNSDSLLIIIAYAKSDNQLSADQRIYFLKEDIHDKLDSYIYDTDNYSNINKFGYTPLDSIQDDYTIETAVKEGAVNLSYNGIDNKENFLEFFNDISSDMDSMIRMIQYTTEGVPVYTDIIFCCENSGHPYFEYNEKNNSAERFDYIITDGKDIYLSNEPEYDSESITRPLCFTALNIDKNIWDDAVPVINDIMKKEALN